MAIRLRALGPLDLDGVLGIARGYVADVEDLPAEAILRGSGGVPAAIHELVTQWASTEAARRLEAAGEWLAEGKTRQAAGLRFADNVIAARLGRIYDAGRAEDRARVCPYRGLGAFEESDAAYFFGREQLVGELAARTVGSGFLGVVGPSGSGKSSVVLAGLIPSLRAGLLPGSDRWDHAVLRPGAASRGRSGKRPGRDRRGGASAFWWSISSRKCSAHGDAGEREAFIDRLVALAHDPKVIVVITIRADFTGHCALYPELADLLAANLVLVGPMTADQLRRVIEAPARRVGLRVESSLVDALVGEVVDEPGGLPLLSTALVQLWQARDGGWLRLDAYQESGGVRTAVARLAEASYQAALRAGATSGDERSSCGLSRQEREIPPCAAGYLLPSSTSTRTHRRGGAVGRLTRDRLLIRDDGLVEIAHEALIREWPRFSSLVEGRRRGAGASQPPHPGGAALGRTRPRRRRPVPGGPTIGGAGLVAGPRPSPQCCSSGSSSPRAERPANRELGRQRRTNRRLRALLAGTADLSHRGPDRRTVRLWSSATTPGPPKERPRPRPSSRTPSGSARWPRPSPTWTCRMLLAVAGVKLKDLPETRSDLLAALQRAPAALRDHPAVDQRDHRPSPSVPTDSSWRPATRRERSGSRISAPGNRADRPSASGAGAPLGAALLPEWSYRGGRRRPGNLSRFYLIDVGIHGAAACSAAGAGRGGQSRPARPPSPSRPDGRESPSGWRLAAPTPTRTCLGAARPRRRLDRAVRLAAALSLARRAGGGQVAFTPDGTLVTSAEQGTTDLWDTRTGRITRQFPIGGRFALSPDGRLAAIGLNSASAGNPATTLALLDLRPEAKRTLQAVPRPTWMATLAFTPDGKASCGRRPRRGCPGVGLSSGSIVQTFSLSQEAASRWHRPGRAAPFCPAPTTAA